MPDRVEVQNLSCAASVPASAPTEVTLDGVVACSVVRVTIRIPAGHSGLTGIALGYGHLAVLPRTGQRYISGDDEVIVYDMADYPPGPQWQAFLMNSDLQAHAWQVRFEVNELRPSGVIIPGGPIDIADIDAAGSALIGAA